MERLWICWWLIIEGFSGCAPPPPPAPKKKAGPNNTPPTEFQVVRTKHVAVKPMSEDEAILQMNLLGHDFFVYRNTEDVVSIVWCPFSTAKVTSALASSRK